MKQRTYAFTIVELLIVIVVIAILATISVVTYTGIQQRAVNTKTEQAVAEWVKILSTYKAMKGQYPNTSACLGTLGSYDGALGCRRDTAATAIIGETPAFYSEINSVTSGPYPTPSLIRHGQTYPYFIGAYWLGSVTPQRIDYVLQGAGSTCGSIGSATFLSTSTDADTNTRICRVAPEQK